MHTTQSELLSSLKEGHDYTVLSAEGGRPQAYLVAFHGLGGASGYVDGAYQRLAKSGMTVLMIHAGGEIVKKYNRSFDQISADQSFRDTVYFLLQQTGVLAAVHQSPSGTLNALGYVAGAAGAAVSQRIQAPSTLLHDIKAAAVGITYLPMHVRAGAGYMKNIATTLTAHLPDIPQLGVCLRGARQGRSYFPFVFDTDAQGTMTFNLLATGAQASIAMDSLRPIVNELLLKLQGQQAGGDVSNQKKPIIAIGYSQGGVMAFVGANNSRRKLYTGAVCVASALDHGSELRLRSPSPSVLISGDSDPLPSLLGTSRDRMGLALQEFSQTHNVPALIDIVPGATHRLCEQIMTRMQAHVEALVENRRPAALPLVIASSIAAA